MSDSNSWISQLKIIEDFRDFKHRLHAEGMDRPQVIMALSAFQFVVGRRLREAGIEHDLFMQESDAIINRGREIEAQLKEGKGSWNSHSASSPD